jgi:hypothetical protein
MNDNTIDRVPMSITSDNAILTQVTSSNSEIITFDRDPIRELLKQPGNDLSKFMNYVLNHTHFYLSRDEIEWRAYTICADLGYIGIETTFDCVRNVHHLNDLINAPDAHLSKNESDNIVYFGAEWLLKTKFDIKEEIEYNKKKDERDQYKDCLCRNFNTQEVAPTSIFFQTPPFEPIDSEGNHVKK